MNKAHRKLIAAAVLLAGLALSGCAAAGAAPDPIVEPLTSAGSNVDVAEPQEATAGLPQNPTTVAIFDWAILDTLYAVGWENTGIETLIIPTNTLPAELEWFATQDFVITGGTLHYVNFDILDLMQPELVILGMRSFAHNAAGVTTSPEERAELLTQAETQYPETAFVRLTQNSTRSQLVQDTTYNVRMLQQIFPRIASELEAALENSLLALEQVGAAVADTGKTALFAMVWDDRMSFFLPESRFHMIYDEFGFASAATELPQWGDQHGFDARAEFVLSVDPDVLLVLDRTDMASPTGGVGTQNLLSDPIIASTTAAQTGKIHVLHGNVWYTMTGGLSAIDAKVAGIQAILDALP
jgi:iron complex transport system substrate-binding protein